MDIKVTIFTPTYNRAYIIENLYNSLVKQTNKRFIWLVVDDGSNDDTREKIAQWIEERKIEIKYIYQSNSGKHIAYNNAIEKSQTELIICIDSDDYLVEDAVETIYQERKHIQLPQVAGILFPRLLLNGKKVKKYPDELRYSTKGELFDKRKVGGELEIAFKTEVVRQYKFPKISGERFISEDYLYDQIDEKYKFYIVNRSICIGQYLQDGYTNGIVRFIEENPKGYALLKGQKMRLTPFRKVKYKSAALYIVGCWLAKQKVECRDIREKILCIAATPLAYAVYVKRHKRIKI